MFYVGVHQGTTNDNYISSSRWFNGEYYYRPNDFRRKIIRFFDDRISALKEEARLIKMITEKEFGKKYYNLKNGKPSGIAPWNKGKTGVITDETRKKMSESKKGNTNTKNRPNPLAAENGRKGADKQSQKAKGRKRKYLPDGSWTWEYPNQLIG